MWLRLIRKLFVAFADGRGNEFEINSRIDGDSHCAQFIITMAIANIGNPSLVLARIVRIPNATRLGVYRTESS